MILAIDTTHAVGSIALVSGGRVVEEVMLDGGDGYGHLLFEALGNLSVAMAEVDGFAAACGPGAFTGVRIGLTAVKGLGEALGKPVYGVSNLEALLSFGRAGLDFCCSTRDPPKHATQPCCANWFPNCFRK